MDLTRRRLLGRAAAATGALVTGSLLGPRVVFAGEAGEAVFEIPVARGLNQTRRAFELIAFERAGHGDPGVQVRARDARGRWTEWLDVPAGHGAARLTDPVWVGPSHAFEVRGRAVRRALLVHSGGPTVTAATKRYVDTGLEAGPGQPQIIARSSWATSSCRPRVQPIFGTVDVAFVHHTVSSNYYRASQSAGMVRAICLFHKYGNGWNDIGYNFVVDRFGQVFEGREGGVDETIVGAQAGGYNFNSTGVALLGNFE